MIPAEATAVDILKWVISPHRPVPAAEALDEDVLFNLAAYHRVEARLLARLDSVRPAWCRPGLRTRFRIQQHTIRRYVGERMAAAREISEAMRSRGQQPPIFVKGFAAYALTGNPNGLHFSGDIDPFAENLPAFWDVLHEIGYVGKRKETHEWAKLHRNGVTLDIHQHFPMLFYPPEIHALPGAALEARQNPGHWKLPAPEFGLVSAAAPLRWENVAPSAVLGRAPGTEALSFPSPTVLCLIHCAHCFRSSVTRLHYMDPRGGFRLYELLSIVELASMPSFDSNLFTFLVDRFAAHDAVQLINTLTDCFLGVKALPKPLPVFEHCDAFPEQLIYGGWVSLQQTEDWLLERGIEQMLDQLDANILPPECRFDAAVIPRRLTHGTDAPLPILSISWQMSQKSVAVDWAFPSPFAAPAEQELLIHFGHGAVVKVLVNAEGNPEKTVQKCDYGHMSGHATAKSIPGSFPTVRVTCPVPTWLDASPAPNDTLPLFLAVRRLCPDGKTTQAVTYLPLVLRP